MPVNPNQKISSGDMLTGHGYASGHDTFGAAFAIAMELADKALNQNIGLTPKGILTVSQGVSHSVVWTPIDEWCVSVLIYGIAA
jgi:hypothetical protein